MIRRRTGITSDNPPIATKNIDGVDYEIRLSDGGKFWTTFDGERLETGTLQGLVGKLRKASRERPVPVAVPLTRIETDTHYRGNKQVPTIKVTQITVIGSQAAGKYNRVAVFTKDDDPEKEQDTLSRYGRDDVYRRLTGPEIQEAVQLFHAMHRAQDAWEAWKDRHEVNALEALAKAQQQAAEQRQTQQTQDAEDQLRQTLREGVGEDEQS